MLDRTPESLYYSSTELSERGFGRALCIAPHPDDEILGAGGFLSMLARAGADVGVLVLTHGEAQAQDAPSTIRAQESKAAARRLGIAEPEFANFRDRDLRYCEPLIAALVSRMDRMPPSATGHSSLLFAPSLSEPHPDHQAVALAAIAAVQRAASDWSLMFYEVGAPSTPNCWVDISGVEADKWAALAEFGSQEMLQPYLDHAKSMAKLRSFGRGRAVSAAEAFFRVSADDLRAKGAAAALPHWTQLRTDRQAANATSQLPLVSVIVRSIDRPELMHAVASVAAQTYPNIELLVVNASGRTHSPVVSPTPNLQLSLVNPRELQSAVALETQEALINRSQPPSSSEAPQAEISQAVTFRDDLAGKGTGRHNSPDLESGRLNVNETIHFPSRHFDKQPPFRSHQAQAEVNPDLGQDNARQSPAADLKVSSTSSDPFVPGSRSIESIPSLGRSAAANLGLKAAQGELALFLDDDDLILPTHLEGLVSHLLARPKAVAAYAGVRVETTGGDLVRNYNVPWSHWRLLGINFLPIHGVLFRLGTVRSAGVSFDESLPVLEDWSFWRDLARHGEFSHLDAITAVYRQGLGDSQLSDTQHPHHWKVWHRKILAKSVQDQSKGELTDWLAELAVSWDSAHARSESLKTSLELANIATNEAESRASSVARELDALQCELRAEQARGRDAMSQYNQSVVELKTRYDRSFEELLTSQNQIRIEELTSRDAAHSIQIDALTLQHRAELKEQQNKFAEEIGKLNAQQEACLNELAKQAALHEDQRQRVELQSQQNIDRLEQELRAVKAEYLVRTEHLQQKLVQALAHESTLLRELNGVYRSRSWRMTQPIRNIRRFWK